MLKFLQENKTRILIAFIAILLVLLSFHGHYHDKATACVKEVSSRMSESSTFITVIKKTISYVASEGIPVIKGYASNTVEDLTKIGDYLTVTEILIKIQTLLLAIFNLTIFKLIPLVFIVGLFLKNYKTIAFKLLLISLFLTPGLSIYVNTIHSIAIAVKIDLGIDLNKKLSETKATFAQKETALKEHQKAIKDKQLEEAKSKGKKKISFLKRAEDAVVNTVEDIGLKVEKDFKIAEEIVLLNTELLLQHLVNLFTSIILLYFILPIFYFYLINLILKSLFQFSINELINQKL
ncbi:hypothetical protein ACFSTE_14075 [Aquimarina hainanensis]|uniref:TrbL/VirB6 plasmid conjugal transfer protein n=1 Tax=Aquimarina hainanensis TaxID=1578017 RepID=A0ABW5NAU4_9FLAO|nr:hypothetical protein [Aquimarina sp. TRL1]QKX03987.1 hypothetical protein HN014_03400 [Aquimarina sp. TRL1]